MTVLAGAELRAPAAHAEPAKPYGDTNIWVHYTASHTKLAVASMSAKTRNSTDTNTVDYRKAIAYFKTSSSNHTTWRRQWGAGWLDGGGKISHITAGELKKVKAVRSSLRALVQAGAQPFSPNCKGINKVTNPHNQGTGPIFTSTTSYYFNSCRTNGLIADAGVCAAALAFGSIAAGKNPWIKALIAMGIFICAATTAQVTAAKSNSSVGSIIIDVSFKNDLVTTGQTWAKVRPQ